MKPAPRSAPLLLASLTLLSALAPAPARAQGEGRLYLDEDPAAETSFKRLEELGKRGQWDQVVIGLDRLLSEGGGKLIRREGTWVSVRSEARRRLLALEGRARAAYLLIHGEEAKQLFMEGRASPEPDRFEAILAKHPATPAVRLARRLLANRYLERGDPALALLHLDALLAELEPGDLRRELQRLRATSLALAGRRGETLNALDELSPADPALRARCEALLAGRARGALPPPAQPGALSWTRPVFGYYETEQGGSQPWSEPVVQAGTLYLHDGSHALALAVESGKLRWRTPLRETDAFRRPSGACPLGIGRGVVVCLERERVSAIDQVSGRLLWSERLSRLKRAAQIDFDAAFADTCAPVVVGSVAVLPLVTMHRDREVHLLAVDLATGGHAWSVFVASETGGGLPAPALAGGAGGVYVATGHGALAAVDARGEVRWLRRYASVRDDRRRGGGQGRFPFAMPRGEQAQQPRRADRGDSTLEVVGRTLWLAAEDGKALLALDAESGEQRARHVLEDPRLLGPHGQGVLALSQGRVLAVTRRGTETLYELSDPEQARLALGAGRLFVGKGRRLSVVELSTKAVSEHAVGAPLGNLVVAAGRLISAAPRGVSGYGASANALTPPASGAAALAQLGDPDWATREAASVALLKSETMVPREQLVAASRAADPEVALRAQIALGELDRLDRLVRWEPLIKQDWTARIPDLLNRLTHPNPEVRLESLRDLGKIDDGDVLALMIDLMNDADSRVAFHAAGVLLVKNNRRGIELLARALKGDFSLEDRKQAAELLIEHGEAADAAILVAALDDPEPEVRALAVEGALKLSQGGALAEVEPLMKDPDPQVRIAVLTALRHAVDNPRAQALLAAAVQDKDDQIRQLAVKSLADERDPAAMRVLCYALGDPVKETARLAASTILKTQQTRGKTEVWRRSLISVDGLEGGVQHKIDANRFYSAQIALRFLGDGGRLSIPALAALMGDREKRIRRLRFAGTGEGWANFLLDRTQGKALRQGDVAAIGTLTLSEDPNTRIQAYQFLAEAGSGPGRGPIIAQGLADEHPVIRRDVGGWLAPSDISQQGLLDPPTMRTVLLVATSSERAEGQAAAKKLLDVGGRERVVPPLLELLGDEELPAEAWVLAGRTLAAFSEGGAAFDPEGARFAQQKRFKAWWFKSDKPPGELEQLLGELVDKNPSKRFMAARKAGEMPTAAVRKALVGSLEGESLRWVLDEKLKALIEITKEDFGYRKRMPADELKQVIERIVAWEREQRE